MSTKEFIRYKKAATEKNREISTDKEKAIEFLFSIGVTTKSGDLKKEFKELCTPAEQD